MDTSKLKDQIAQRLSKDSQKAKAEQEIEKNQEEQKQKQKRRGDYAEILRTNLYGVLTVQNPGDYADDLLEFQEQVRVIIASIPTRFITDTSIEDLTKFFKKMMQSIKITGRDSESLETLMGYQIKTRMTITILGDESLRQRMYNSCMGVKLGGRLSTLALLVHKQDSSASIEEFELACRTGWENFLNAVDEINSLEYITDSYCPYILSVNLKHGIWGASYSNELPGDPVYTLVSYFPYAEGQKVSLKDQMIPRIQVIKNLATAMESAKFPQSAINDFKDYYTDVPGLFHRLMHKLEIYGVWTTNQCVEHSTSPHYFGPLTEQMLELINQYMEISPVAVAYMLRDQSVDVGTHMFYNCPEESMLSNELIPAKILEILQHAKVKSVFKGKKSPIWIKDRLKKLWKVVYAELKWKEAGPFSFYLQGKSNSSDFFVNTWHENLNNKEYWEDKKEAVQA